MLNTSISNGNIYILRAYDDGAEGGKGTGGDEKWNKHALSSSSKSFNFSMNSNYCANEITIKWEKAQTMADAHTHTYHEHERAQTNAEAEVFFFFSFLCCFCFFFLFFSGNTFDVMIICDELSR